MSIFWTLICSLVTYNALMQGRYFVAFVALVFALLFGLPMSSFRWLRTKLPW